jgi:ketosteroid isomerase-like protein
VENAETERKSLKSTPMHAQETSDAAQVQVQELENRWLDCYLRGDSAGFADLLDEQFVYSSERGVFQKAEYVANLASGVIQMRNLQNVELKIYFHSDTAVSIGIVQMSASFRGEDISGKDRFTRVWQKQGDTYRAIALHANSIRYDTNG